MNRTPVRFLSVLQRGTLRRGAVFGGILLLALLAFEVFNYSTTEFALNDLLGSDLRFLGIRWAVILSVAFCGIDFAGIARLFTPEQGRDEPAEVWYLFGAWLLAAAMNALLTWWGVAVAVRTHQEMASAIISQKTLATVIPIFVALMVWLIRVLIIGTFAMAGDRMFSMAEGRSSMLGSALRSRPSAQPVRPGLVRASDLPRPNRPVSTPFRPAPKPEPTYHPAGLTASPREGDTSVRR
jgi:hypothetical protein